MRVVLASRIYDPEPSAASFRLRALAAELAAAGAEVLVLTSRAPEGETAPSPAGVDVRRARVLRDAAGYVRGYLPYLSFDVPLALRLLVARRPAVVVVEPPPTTGLVVRVVAALRRIPYVYYAADVWGDAAANATSSAVVLRVVRGMERAAWRGAAALLSVSPGVSARLAESGVDASKIVEIGNGLEGDDFAPDGSLAEVDGPTFVYAGTASEVHGAGIFVEAFARVVAEHPDARLVFIGQGADRAELESAASALPTGSVRFLPRLAPTEVASWLRAATAALASVRPGVGYDFAFPTKLYAAVACGTPVIHAGPGPGGEYVERLGVGDAVAFDVDAVAEAMRRALPRPVDPVARRAAAERSRQRDVDSPARVAARSVLGLGVA